MLHTYLGDVGFNHTLGSLAWLLPIAVKRLYDGCSWLG